MKGFFVVLVLSFFAVCPMRVHAVGAAEAAIVGVLEANHVLEYAQFLLMVKNTLKAAEDTYEDLQHTIKSTERAIKNLQSIVDVRSLSDFMAWNNRQLYLEREVETRYSDISVKVGRNTFRLHEIDEVPDALRNSLRDTFDGNFTEDEKRDMFVSLGLAPSNYAYLKTWEERNQKIAKEIMTYNDVFYDELEEAKERNENIMGKYRVPGDEPPDINEISKEAHITAMNTEMAIREQNRLLVEMHQYTLSRDKIMDTPPTPFRLSDRWNYNVWEPITEGYGVNSYEIW
jgi:hypothetical protein